MDDNPVKHFDDILKSHKFIFIVYYRGHWCPFCMSYLKTFTSLMSDIKAKGGMPIIATAETVEHLDSTRASTGYDGEAIVDPRNSLAAELKRRGFLEIAISEKKGYEHGMAQPAVLVLTSDDTVLQKWAIIPSAMNLGGAKDRANLSEIWENTEALLEGNVVKYPRLSSIGALSVLRENIKKLWIG